MRNLLASDVQEDAKRIRDAFLPRSEAGLMKLTLPTIRAAMEQRSLDLTGQKAQLVSRLLAALQAEAQAATA